MNDRWKMIKDLIEDIEGMYEMCNLELSSWEIEFLDSVSMQFSSKDDLSDKQIEILERIRSKK